MPLQNLLAKQGLRLLRGLRRDNVQEKVALAKKLLAKLHFLAQGVMTHPLISPPPNTLTLSFPEASGQGRPNICPVGRSQAMGPVALDVGPSSIWSS